jgi:5-oxoprolinase (ATP-hydrolysing) subunit A
MAETSLRAIDLNCDCGESFGAWTMGDDAGVLPYMSSANIACGGHAGDPHTMWATVALCLRLGLAIGAHTGHRDLSGFGRRAIPVTPDELRNDTLAQIGALSAIVGMQGGKLRHVKPHGALYHQVDRDARLAAAYCSAVAAFDGGLVMVGPPAGALSMAATQTGLRFVAEGFVERGYGADGKLLPRGQAGAELEAPEAALAQALDLVQRGGVAAQTGEWLPLPVQTLCLHGDRHDAVGFARVVRGGIEAAGVSVRAA